MSNEYSQQASNSTVPRAVLVHHLLPYLSPKCKEERIQTLQKQLSTFITELDDLLAYLVETNIVPGHPIVLPDTSMENISLDRRISWEGFKNKIDNCLKPPIHQMYTEENVCFSVRQVLAFWIDFDQIQLSDLTVVSAENYVVYIEAALLNTAYLRRQID